MDAAAAFVAATAARLFSQAPISRFMLPLSGLILKPKKRYQISGRLGVTVLFVVGVEQLLDQCGIGGFSDCRAPAADNATFGAINSAGRFSIERDQMPEVGDGDEGKTICPWISNRMGAEASEGSISEDMEADETRRKASAGTRKSVLCC